MKDETPFDHRSLVQGMTARPGVYRMLDEAGNVLYVGKARNLKRRVGSYFRASGLDTKTMALVSRIADIEVTVVSSETEALLLEQNLIKKLRPPYNIQLRDDKSYPYIMLTDRDTYPRLAFYRGSRRRKASFFGPYPSASAVRETLAILQKVFRLRQCEDSYFRNRSRPCLQYQIDRCTAPCVDYISPQDYAEDVHFTRLFLEGRSDRLIHELANRMEQRAGSLEFEAAARLRDQITELRSIQDQQSVAGQQGDADVLAAVMESGHACVHCIYIRGGRVIGSRNFFPTDRLARDSGELLGAFMAHYYVQDEQAAALPGELLVTPRVENRTALEEALSGMAGRRVRVRDAVRSHRARWLDMARESAGQGLRGLLNDRRQVHQRFAELQDALELEEAPQRIECFDISHTAGERTVASCVVFDVNGPRKSDYRRYNIDGIAGGDDYAAMDQALRRRFRPPAEADSEERRLPDILLIDGGKGQLRQAREVLESCRQEETRLSDVLLLGIAKGISRKAGQETLYLTQGEGYRELVLNETAPALHLLQQVRDEAHRFAITGHRARRGKARKRSPLEDIPGLGPRRRQALLRYFGGQAGLRRASEAQIARVEGISTRLAADVYAALHNG